MLRSCPSTSGHVFSLGIISISSFDPVLSSHAKIWTIFTKLTQKSTNSTDSPCSVPMSNCFDKGITFREKIPICFGFVTNNLPFILLFLIFCFIPRNLNFQWRWAMALRTTLPLSFDFLTSFFFFLFANINFASSTHVGQLAVVEWILYSSVIQAKNKSTSAKRNHHLSGQNTQTVTLNHLSEGNVSHRIGLDSFTKGWGNWTNNSKKENKKTIVLDGSVYLIGFSFRLS